MSRIARRVRRGSTTFSSLPKCQEHHNRGEHLDAGIKTKRDQGQRVAPSRYESRVEPEAIALDIDAIGSQSRLAIAWIATSRCTLPMTGRHDATFVTTEVFHV